MGVFVRVAVITTGIRVVESAWAIISAAGAMEKRNKISSLLKFMQQIFLPTFYREIKIH
jgi:hypothetical protein